MVEHYELRKLLAITGTKHKDLAKVIGVSQQATSKKIKGEAEFKQTEMILITEYFKKLQTENSYLQKNYPPVTMDLLFYEEISEFTMAKIYKDRGLKR